MHKGLGRQQQIRGQKRAKKVLNMKRRRNPNAIKANAGEKYWNELVNDEYNRQQNVENSSIQSKAQVLNVKQQVHRRKSG